MGIRTISPKMMETQLEGYKVVDLDFTTLWVGPVLDLKLLPSTSFSSSSSSSSSSSLLSLGFSSFFSNVGYPGIFVTSRSGGWMGGLTSPIHQVQSPK